jgi:hypothetical protein
MALNLRPLPLFLHTNRLLLQRTRSNMVPFIFALEANNLGQILDLFLSLLLIYFGLLLIIEINPSSLFSFGDFCTLKILLSVDFPS